MKRTTWFKMLIVVALTVPLSGGGLLAHGAKAQQDGPHGPGLEGLTQPAVVQADLGGVVTYQGRLTHNGSPVDGTRDLMFTLYDAATEGTQVGDAVVLEDVILTDGLFTVDLDFGSPNVFTGRALWLEISRHTGPGLLYWPLSPRQRIAAAPYAHSLRPGAGIEASDGTVLNLKSTGTIGRALNAEATHPTGMSTAVWASSESTGASTGVFWNKGGGIALQAQGEGGGRQTAALRVKNTNEINGMAAYLTNDSGFATAHFGNDGAGEVLYLTNGATTSVGVGGGDFILAKINDESDVQFRVATTGKVFSDVGYDTPANDMAEMLPAAAGVEPGDVLVIGADGLLARSTEIRQSTVMGVHSTEPGFVGGQTAEGSPEGHVPLAVVGIVPVKVSAENGPITPGALLVSASIRGHAMHAGESPEVGTVIGKAMGTLESGTGVIRMLVMLQ